MKRLESFIEIEAPIQVVYDQWIHCEDFPQIMKAVDCVDKLPDDRIYWCIKVLGFPIEWEAEIVSLIPRQEIAWRSVAGHPNEGLIVFSPLKDGGTHVMVRVEYQPVGVIEEVGDALGIADLMVSQSLRSMKAFIEGQGRLQPA